MATLRTALVLLFATLAGCGGSTTLTPELIGRLTFDYLKANNFPAYYTGLVVTPAQVEAVCPALAGITRYFETGDGSSNSQEDRFLECRSNIDFANATLTRVTVRTLSNTLAPPECAAPLSRVDVDVEVNVGGTAHYFTVGDVILFGAGWKVYKRIKDCGTVAPST